MCYHPIICLCRWTWPVVAFQDPSGLHWHRDTQHDRNSDRCLQLPGIRGGYMTWLLGLFIPLHKPCRMLLNSCSWFPVAERKWLTRTLHSKLSRLERNSPRDQALLEVEDSNAFSNPSQPFPTFSNPSQPFLTQVPIVKPLAAVQNLWWEMVSPNPRHQQVFRVRHPSTPQEAAVRRGRLQPNSPQAWHPIDTHAFSCVAS